MRFVFDDHGAMRALERGINGLEVQLILKRFDEESEGWLAGSRIRVGTTNGRRLAVLFFPGDPICVH